MAVSDEVRARLKTLQKKMASQGQEVSMDELIRAHERGISGKEAKVLDGMLKEAKAKIRAEIDAGKISSLLGSDK
jgi:uncharacterized protein YajQ (UPF0234 family)